MGREGGKGRGRRAGEGLRAGVQQVLCWIHGEAMKFVDKLRRREVRRLRTPVRSGLRIPFHALFIDYT